MVLSIVYSLYATNALVCDHFEGGPILKGAIRGTQCQCQGWKFYLINEAPADEQDLSLCLGRIKSIQTIK